MSHFFVKSKSSESSLRTIVDSRKFQRENSSADEDFDKFEFLNKKLTDVNEDQILHKASKETCKLQDQQIESMNDLDDEDNEFLILFFSGINYENCMLKNETVCGYFQKTFSALLCQIRGEVLFFKIFVFYFIMIDHHLRF